MPVSRLESEISRQGAGDPVLCDVPRIRSTSSGVNARFESAVEIAMWSFKRPILFYGLGTIGMRVDRHDATD